MNDNSHLEQARRAKNNEFYTRFEDIEREVAFHAGRFAGKKVYSNCDSDNSAFFQFFVDRFGELKLDRFGATAYERRTLFAPPRKAWHRELISDYITGTDGKTAAHFWNTPLSGDGDFRSEECIELLRAADIIVTNPPFSLFRSFLKTCLHWEKDFLIIGPITAIRDKTIFPYLKYGHFRLGCTRPKYFRTPAGETAVLNNCRWFTTFPVDRPPLPLTKKYNPAEYPRYDDTDAINVDRYPDIPADYPGIMGVPLTFAEAFCPRQFELITTGRFHVNGEEKYERILIRRRY